LEEMYGVNRRKEPAINTTDRMARPSLAPVKGETCVTEQKSRWQRAQVEGEDQTDGSKALRVRVPGRGGTAEKTVRGRVGFRVRKSQHKTKTEIKKGGSPSEFGLNGSKKDDLLTFRRATKYAIAFCGKHTKEDRI